jgi:hypothetical protein
MTYQEAEEKLREMEDLGYRAITYESRFHQSVPDRICGLYSEKYGGIVVNQPTWEKAFIELEAKVIAATGRSDKGSIDQAPTEDIAPAPEVKSDVPF